MNRLLIALVVLGGTLFCSGSAHAEEPRVLIIGDSISIGYTSYVQKALKGEAIVLRCANAQGRTENSAGTTNGVKQIDRWLKLGTGEWDVIHVNFGLHDLKRVDPKTGKNSNDPKMPNQASPEVYEKQLREIIGKLKKTGATIIIATTTPVPAGGVKPHRDVTGPAEYNAIAVKIAKEHGITVNDLYGFANPILKKIQRPVNVHFTAEGSKLLADQVVKAIRKALNTQNAKAAP